MKKITSMRGSTSRRHIASLGGAFGLGGANGARTAFGLGAALDNIQGRRCSLAAVFSAGSHHESAGGCFDEPGPSQSSLAVMTDDGSGDGCGVFAL